MSVRTRLSRIRPDRGAPSALAATVFAAAGTAALVEHRTRAAERAHPPRGSFVTCGGGRLHYLDQGVGHPVMFLHGNGLMAEDFAASGLLDKASGRGYRAIAVDRPGFGYSDRDWFQSWSADVQAAHLLDAMEKIGVERPVIVAHSWASMVALEMALKRPEAVKGLVLVSGYYFPSVRADVALFSPPAIPILGDVIRYTVGPIIGEALKPRLLRKVFAPHVVPRVFWERFPHALMTRPSQIRAAAEDASHMIGSAAALKDRYADLRLPVSIVAGESDKIIDPGQPERLHGAIRGSTFHLIPGAGHMLHYAHGNAVMDQVEAVAA